jgi:hypothetical protein
MKTNVFAMLALAVLANCPGSAATVYDSSTGPDNGTTFPFSGLGSSQVQIGDSITLAGSDRLLQSATVRFYNLSETGGTFDATLRFWEVGTLPSVVGSQIGSDYLANVSLNSFEILNVTFPGLNLLVAGNSLVFTIEISNLSKDVDPGLIAHTSDPTNIGSSNDSALITRVGAAPFTAPGSTQGEGNLYLVLDAGSEIPEPATITMAAAALLLFVARKRSTR